MSDIPSVRENQSPGPASGSPGGNKVATRILVVEDDPKISESLCRSLREIGYRVESSPDASAIPRLLGEGAFDLMLLDLMLPGGKDGFDVLRETRAAGFNLPIIVLSALVDIDDRLTALRTGADDYLAKPFSFAELTLRMENLLRRCQPASPGR